MSAVLNPESMKTWDSVMNTIGDVDSLEALARQSHEQNDRQSEMLALRHKGDLLRLKSRYIEAINVHKRGLEIAVDMNDTIEMAMALNSLGDDHRRLGELSDANGYYFDNNWSARPIGDRYVQTKVSNGCGTTWDNYIDRSACPRSVIEPQ